jgi:hypothetical protein
MIKYIIAFGLSLLTFGCQNIVTDSDDLHETFYTPKGELDIGLLDSGTYKNRYFGFSLRPPGNDWYILHDRIYDKLIEKGKQQYITDGLDKDELEKTVENMFNLITLERPNPDGSNVSYQTISFTAEKATRLKDVKSSRDYFILTEKFIKENPANSDVSIIGLESAKISNRPFLVQSLEINSGKLKFYQRTYSALFDTWLLNIIVLFQDQDQLIENEKVLNTIVWN